MERTIRRRWLNVLTNEPIAKLLLRHSGESRKAELNVHNHVFSVSSEPRLLPGRWMRLFCNYL
jgi:hypothetical protein